MLSISWVHNELNDRAVVDLIWDAVVQSWRPKVMVGHITVIAATVVRCTSDISGTIIDS